MRPHQRGPPCRASQHMTGPCVQGWVDGTGPYSLSLPGPLHLMPLVSRLPSSFSVSRFGRPSDHHHHRLPHHGHSCSDYNSCLKKLVRTLGPSGWVTGVSGGPWGNTHTERFLLLNSISAHSLGNHFSVWDGECHAAPALLNLLPFAQAALPPSGRSCSLTVVFSAGHKPSLLGLIP